MVGASNGQVRSFAWILASRVTAGIIISSSRRRGANVRVRVVCGHGTTATTSQIYEGQRTCESLDRLRYASARALTLYRNMRSRASRINHFSQYPSCSFSLSLRSSPCFTFLGSPPKSATVLRSTTWPTSPCRRFIFEHAKIAPLRNDSTSHTK